MTQSTPGFVGGEYPTGAQWDSYFAVKLDVANIPAVDGALMGSTSVAGVMIPITLGTGLTLSAANVLSYALPTAATSVTLGLVSPDSATILNNAGAIRVNYGTVLNTAAQGNDSRIVNALQTTAIPAGATSLLGGTASVGAAGLVTVGANLSLVSGVLSALAGSATVVRVITAAGNVTVLASDGLVTIKKTTAAATAVTLEASPATGARHIIKDGKGDSATNNITISPASGTIDGSANYVLNISHESIEIIFNGTEWNIV